MSNSHLFLKSGFPRAPLQNGIGRVVMQLQRITFKFCKNHGASRGIREFLETDLIDFSKNNPGIVVYVKPRRHRSPNLTVEYCKYSKVTNSRIEMNGERQVVNCHNFSREEVSKWVTLLRTQSGNPTIRYRKLWHTDSPSIQGPWTPFTNRRPELNLAQFPRKSLVGIAKEVFERTIDKSNWWNKVKEAVEEKNKGFRKSFKNKNEETEEYRENKKRVKKPVVQEPRKDCMQKWTEILERDVERIKMLYSQIINRRKKRQEFRMMDDIEDKRTRKGTMDEIF
uniref:Large ribosomal subunit protein mL43 n=1 Tax=Timema cristinae TaxID=61476 RepID=A0A7R9CT98_TIMCR|nr:unnamed protein product [Timema cristinae]